MYLESLKVNGFKSFARKTTFKFNDGVTVIVGPNGCGKSNTVDALRWVLGEQRAGSIRSEKMENVIFNGTKDTKPLGMAEVSLRIHNTKNVLPIEYSEIEITRRLFRSMESQYLLNNTPCRLKDILNLFMDTGMGANAYSIIELSMVETILNGRPEERRHIIEEAAGVTKYKVRRKAAFRKLEATEADLLRVNDIISEVEKTVASLQRQVRKAQRYQDLRGELQEKDILLATHQVAKIQAELEPMLERLKETQTNRVSLTTRFDQKEAEMEEARRKLLESEHALSQEQQVLNQASLRIQKKEEEILVGRERRKALEDAKVKLDRDQQEVQVRLEKNKVQRGATGEKLQKLFEQIQVAENDFGDKNAHLSKLESQLTDRRDQIKALEMQRLQAVEGLTEGKKDEERLKTQLANISDRVKIINREVEENELLQRIRREKIDKQVDSKTTVAAELRNLQEELNECQQHLASLAEQKDGVREQILLRRTEVETLRERIELLKKFIESYEDHPDGVQHILLQGFLNGGCKGTLAENLKVSSTYRRALETAIGEASVSLIVEGTDQAFQCIEQLKADEKGAVTFFPLDRFHDKGSNGNGAAASDIVMEDGLIDWAYNLVDCERDYQPVVKGLLRDFVVVKDMATAQAHAGRLQSLRLNLVTLNGEIISTWGPIKGGASENSNAAIIGRKALVGELEKELEGTFKRLDEEESQRLQIEQDYQRRFAQEQDLSRKVKSSEGRLNEVEMQLTQLDFEARKDAEQRERLLNEKKQHMENEAELRDEFDEISPALSGLVDDKSKFETTLLNISEEQAQLEEALNEERTVAQDSRVKLVDLKSEEKHLQENLAQMQEFDLELQKTLLRIEQEMHNSTAEHSEIDEAISASKTVIEAEFKEYNGLQTRIEQLEQKFLQEKEELTSREKFIRDIRDEKDLISETLHSMELRVSELKMTGDKLRDRINDEYNVQIQKSAVDAELDEEQLGAEIARARQRVENMGPVNLLALKEYEKEKERFDFLVEQRDDLIEAQENLNHTIKVINKTAQEQFQGTFKEIRENFIKVFTGFFEAGQADLRLSESEDPLEADVVIEADPKGRKIGSISLLSGGEKTLTAISLLFAIYLVKPSPFCVLDEVDAPLDDANIGRFVKAIRKFSENTQFIIVTHNKLTMREADCLYGVTMEQEGISKVVSVNFTEMEGVAA